MTRLRTDMPTVRRVARGLGAAAIATLLTAGTVAAGTPVSMRNRDLAEPDARTAAAPTLRTTRVGSASFASPIFVTAAPGDAGALYVVEQPGRIKRVRRTDGVVLNTFLDIQSRVLDGGERGLLGLAFHPSYATNRKFYVYYTQNDGKQRVAEFTKTSTGFTERAVLVMSDQASNHNGGMLAFKGSYLYISTGDGGPQGDPENDAQELENSSVPTYALLGKILRINPLAASGRAYTVPTDNPYVGKAGRDEIWSHGLRNPWRFSFDRANGYIWVADVGQSAWEEVNRHVTGKAVDFGWACTEGKHYYSRKSGCTSSSGVAHVFREYSHSSGRAAVAGGYVYRGGQSTLKGRYFYADTYTGEIWAPMAYTTGDTAYLNTSLMISSFGEDAYGGLYVTALNTGGVYRVLD